MKIVLAFDSFKGCLTAAEVCASARAGVLSVRPDAEVVGVPLSDGGEGLVECFVAMGKARPVTMVVHGPLAEEVAATYAISLDGQTAYMEMASACGLTLVSAERRNVMEATTYGLGELLLDASARGVAHIVLGIGGSATCDAGMGMLEALGASVRAMPVLTVACDVTNPLYGPNGAACVFAPQKGATFRQVEVLDQRLRAFAMATEEMGLATNEDAFRPGAGAAGGLGYALQTHLGATLRSGIDLVLDACGFDQLLTGADLVVTGEGCSDRQTVQGKVAAGVLRRAREQGVSTVLMSGQIKDGETLLAHGFDRLCSVNEGDTRPLSTLMRPDVAAENVKRTCRRLMEELA